jgi:hypothetical protein
MRLSSATTAKPDHLATPQSRQWLGCALLKASCTPVNKVNVSAVVRPKRIAADAEPHVLRRPQPVLNVCVAIIMNKPEQHVVLRGVRLFVDLATPVPQHLAIEQQAGGWTVLQRSKVQMGRVMPVH